MNHSAAGWTEVLAIGLITLAAAPCLPLRAQSTALIVEPIEHLEKCESEWKANGNPAEARKWCEKGIVAVHKIRKCNKNPECVNTRTQLERTLAAVSEADLYLGKAVKEVRDLTKKAELAGARRKMDQLQGGPALSGR